jgi:hypothetical protein
MTTVARWSLLGIVWTATFLLACVTATANFRYGMLVGGGQERWIYAIGGTVLDVVKTFLPTLLATFLPNTITLGTFFRAVAGWSLWCVAVAWSITCALGLYALVKDAKVGDVKADAALYQQLTSDKKEKQDQLDRLDSVVTAEVLQGQIDALKRDRVYSRSNNCANATAADSRDLCAKLDTLAAQKANAIPAEQRNVDQSRLKDELHKIDTRLAGLDIAHAFQQADPATEALAGVLGWDPKAVKDRLALMLAILFEGAGLLPWIVTGSHGSETAQRPARVEEKDDRELKDNLKAESHKRSGVKTDAELLEVIDLPEIESCVAVWARERLVRRKGSYVLASDMGEEFDQWCMTSKSAIMTRTAFGKEMTRLGFTRKKVGGKQRYQDVGLAPKVRQLRVAVDNTAAYNAGL